MKAVEQQQPNSMESNNSTSGSSSTDYAYRPLTTKHRRAGSTGTTGDEEYTTDEDEYGDETDFTGSSLHPSHLILKSDLARATTDLFGYGLKYEDRDDEPTSLFDEDDNKCQVVSSSKAIQVYSYNENVAPSREGVLTRHQKPTSTASQVSKDVDSSKHICDQTSGQSPDLADNRIKTDDTRATEILSTSADMKEASESIRDSWFRANEDETETETEEGKLQEELKKTKEQLKLKDEEVLRLSRIRSDVETELQDLTASLFQEAHNMVQEAKNRQANAEKLLEESRMKNEVLAAEVAALKTLVLTSTPARPNPHLHPQIDSRCQTDGQAGLFTKKHRRSPSHFNLKYGRENSPPESPQKEQRSSLPDKCVLSEVADRDWDKERSKDKDQTKDQDRDRERHKESQFQEADPRVLAEFLHWKANPMVDVANPFVKRIFREDIDLCLDFPNQQLGAKVRQAVLEGIIFIEAVSDKTKPNLEKKCALFEVSRQCYYRMRLGDQENQWHFISKICRNRIIAVCDFLNYLRYVERGLVKSSDRDIYWEIVRLRKEMVNARLSLMLSS